MKTVLCVPGHDERKVLKCREYGADLILFDLEDAVPVSEKKRAREIVAAAVTREDAVRINSEPELSDLDVQSVIAGNAGQLWLPKSVTYSVWLPYIHELDIRVVPIIETPAVLFSVMPQISYLREHSLGGLAFGADDYAANTRTERNSRQVEYARMQVAMIAAALGVDSYDSPCVSMNRDDVIYEIGQARALGYTYKGVIHPQQIEWIREHCDDVDTYDRERAAGALKHYDAQPESVVLLDNHLLTPPFVRRLRVVTE